MHSTRDLLKKLEDCQEQETVILFLLTSLKISVHLSLEQINYRIELNKLILMVW